MRASYVAIAIAVAAGAGLAGCKRSSSLYCDSTNPTCEEGVCNVDLHVCVDMLPDAGPVACDPQVPDSCANHPETPFCDPDDNICKPCGSDTDCPDEQPVCDLDTNTCTRCTSDDDCGSGVCLYEGGCASPDDVIYTAGGASASGPCDQANPCELVYGVATYNMGNRTIVHLAAGDHVINNTVDITHDATLVGRGAHIIYASGSDGNAVRISGSGVGVTLDYIRVEDAQGSGINGSGVRCEGGPTTTLLAREVTARFNENAGIDAAGCTVTILGSTLRQNEFGLVSSNGAGVTIETSTIRRNNQSGIEMGVNGSLDLLRSIILLNQDRGGIHGGSNTMVKIENNLIIANGNAGSGTGGVELFGVQPTSVFRFNTVSNNVAQDSSIDGLVCNGLNLVASSNVINDEMNCAALEYSLFGPDAGPPTGTNLPGVPTFLDTDTVMDPVGPEFYRITMTSAGVDDAEDLAAVNMDIDGDVRPPGARDIGADEAQP